jgi:hypothetical protein
MIVLVTNDLSEQLCDIPKLIGHFGFTKLQLYSAPFTFTFSIEGHVSHLIHHLSIKHSLIAFKQASKIIVHLQPSKDDLRDPYFEYIPLIYSFLHYHPCIKAKTFFIQPFYLPHSVEDEKLKQIYIDKIKLGDFQEILSDFQFTLPVTPEQVDKLHEIIIKLVNDDSTGMY